MAFYSKMSEKQIFSSLMNGDEEVWIFIMLKVVKPVLLNKSNALKIKDALLTSEDIVAKLYERLIFHKKLENFSGSGSLFGYISTAANCLISEELKRFKSKCRGYKERKKINQGNTGKDIGNENHKKPLADPGEQLQKIVEIPMDIISFNTFQERSRMNEKFEVARICFQRLWERNPFLAMVLLLHFQYGFSVEQIKNFLKISTTATARNRVKEAIRLMRAIRVSLVKNYKKAA